MASRQRIEGECGGGRERRVVVADEHQAVVADEHRAAVAEEQKAVVTYEHRAVVADKLQMNTGH
jgi:hypothetical protein